MESFKQITSSDAQTQALAAELKKRYPSARYWLLFGELGAGKTTFVKGYATALGLPQDSIKSPTFSLIEDHGSFVHADLYRLTAPDAALEAQLHEYAAEGKTVLIEWPERLSVPPSGALKISFVHQDPQSRLIEASPSF